MISQRLTNIPNALSIELNEIVYELKAKGNDMDDIFEYVGPLV